MRQRIRLDTLTDARKFVDIASSVKGNVTLEDGTGYKVNAKSLLGALCSMEFRKIFCVSDEDITGKIINFII